MRDYAKVSPQFWTRGSGKKLRGDADAQVLALYLVTCPGANMVGVYYLPLVTMCHETGLSVDDARAALARLQDSGFASYDEDAELAWVPNMAAYQLGDELKAGDKRRGAVLAQLEQAGEHPFVTEFLKLYGAAFNLVARSVPKTEGASKGLRRGFEGASANENTPSKGMLDPREEQEQEKEQEQEQDPSGGSDQSIPDQQRTEPEPKPHEQRYREAYEAGIRQATGGPHTVHPKHQGAVNRIAAGHCGKARGAALEAAITTLAADFARAVAGEERYWPGLTAEQCERWSGGGKPRSSGANAPPTPSQNTPEAMRSRIARVV